MLDDVICDRDRHDLLNILCKMCSRQRMIPKSMRMDNCVNGELIEECNGGYATVFRGEHKGRPVAVKIVRVYLTNDFDKCLSVNTLRPYTTEVAIDHEVYRNSAERLLHGGISDTRTSYRYLV